MQNKGALRFLVIALAIACAYQLSFTAVTRIVERKAVQYSAGDPAKEVAYLDSIKSQPVYNLGLVKFTYKECKEKEINLGLDLRGGMNVMLEIDVQDVVRALADNSKDPAFNQAMEVAASKMKSSSGDFVEQFAQAYQQITGGGQLAAIFNTSAMKGQISFDTSNEEVVKVLKKQADDAISNSFNVLRSRIDHFGVTQPNIQRLESSGRILVELPGIKEPERVRKLLQGTASLEFWATYNNTEIYPILAQANRVIKELEDAAKVLGTNVVEEKTVDGIPEGDILDQTQALPEANPVENTADQDLLSQIETADSASVDQAAMMANMPLFSKLNPMVDQAGNLANGPVVGHALGYDTVAINRYLNLPQVKSLFPRGVKLLWGIKAIDEAGTVFELYAINGNTRDGKAPLDGTAVVEATEQYSQRGSSAEVSMSMSGSGGKTWARLTEDNIGNSIAIVLDGYVYSAPRVQNAITGGQSQITGKFTIQEARDLANVLKSGKLPAPARIIQDTVVGPSLGEESINAGMLSFILAFVLVLLYMWLYYNTAGGVANIALLTNLFFLFGILAAFGAVLTLPGIAGIVLTMGMAVDANVIIYERIKEELRAGKGVNLSVTEGYKHAMSAIVDGNATTMITGIVLFLFGTGPVQGFATTLIIGIFTSFFTSIFISRLVITSVLESGRKIRFSNRLTENFLANVKFDFIGVRKYAYAASIVLFIIAIGSLATRGLNYGVDFSGGRVYVVRFDQNVTANDVRERLNAEFASEDAAKSSIEVKQFGKENQMRIVTQYKYDDTREEVAAELDSMLYNALGGLYKTPLTLDEFKSTAENPNGIISSDKVGPSVARGIKINSIIAVCFSLLAIMLYIALRFRKWQWGLGGALSLGHDAFLTIGLFSLLYGVLPFNMEVDQSFIAAILTIIGYSINDTVVIFDRIREYNREHAKRSMRQNINEAISSTLARTLNTAGTTVVVLLAIFLFGGEVIRGFVFALLFGIVMGTFSSVFVATPLAYDMMSRKVRKEE